MTIHTEWSYYVFTNTKKSLTFPKEFWNLVKLEFEDVPTTHDVEVKNAYAKRIYDELAAVAIPYICKLHGVTPDDVELVFESDWPFEEIGKFTYEVDYMHDIVIAAPTPESQAAIDEMLKAEPTLNYSGNRERYYISSEYDEFEDWQAAYERDIKSHYIDPIAKRFGLDANDFEIRDFGYEFY